MVEKSYLYTGEVF